MNTKSLGQRLHELRVRSNYSMRKAAGLAGISVAYLSKLEQDEGNPTLDVLEKLASAFVMTVEELNHGTAWSNTSTPMPDSLKLFVAEYAGKFEELSDPDWQRMLSGIRLRGRYPENARDWLSIFLDLQLILNKSRP
jgi:transcriptional regulator with XRE-family HTH domain